MMGSQRAALRGLTRRVTIQVIKQALVDGEAVQNGVELRRASLLMVPSPARKIAMKPEGQRTWKWWDVKTSERLELGWFIKPDRDSKRLFEVLEDDSLPQARIYSYQMAEAPR